MVSLPPPIDKTRVFHLFLCTLLDIEEGPLYILRSVIVSVHFKEQHGFNWSGLLRATVQRLFWSSGRNYQIGGPERDIALIGFRLYFLLNMHISGLSYIKRSLVVFDPRDQNLMFNLCIYPLEKSQEADFFFLLRCWRLLITLLDGSYWKDVDCLLYSSQLSNQPQGAGKMHIVTLAEVLKPASVLVAQGAKLVHSVPCSSETSEALMVVWPVELSQCALSSVLLE